MKLYYKHPLDGYIATIDLNDVYVDEFLLESLANYLESIENEIDALTKVCDMNKTWIEAAKKELQK